MQTADTVCYWVLHFRLGQEAAVAGDWQRDKKSGFFKLLVELTIQVPAMSFHLLILIYSLSIFVLALRVTKEFHSEMPPTTTTPVRTAKHIHT